MEIKFEEEGLSPLSGNSFYHIPSDTAMSTYYFVQSLGHFSCAEDYYTKRIGYKSFLLLYTVSGKGFVKVREKVFELSTGRAILINCMEYHEYYTGEGALWEMKWLHFNGSSSEGYFKILYENCYACVDIIGDSPVSNHLDELMTLLKKNDKLFDIKASGLISSILTEIMLAQSILLEDSAKHTVDSFIQKVQTFIQKNYISKVSTEDMANIACISKFHFIRLFKKATGYSPYEYLMKYRIGKAKMLLTQSNLSVEEICTRVGFGTTCHFIKIFRLLEGMPPLKYRKYWK